MVPDICWTVTGTPAGAPGSANGTRLSTRPMIGGIKGLP